MIDTKELRDRAATFGSDYLTDEEWVEVIDRLEAAEKERDALRAELKGAHAMALNGAEWRELAQKYEAEIAAMKRQAPVAWARKLGLDVPSFGCVTDLKYRPSDIPESSYIPLYTLPGAQPAPSVPDGWKLVPTEPTEEMTVAGVRAGAVYYAISKDVWGAMLAAAPEAKQ